MDTPTASTLINPNDPLGGWLVSNMAWAKSNNADDETPFDVLSRTATAVHLCVAQSGHAAT